MEDKWYVINVVSGKDLKAKELLEFDLKHTGLNKYVKEVVVPIEKYKSLKNKKTVVKERNLLTGYMLINVTKMNPEVVQIVNNTNYIIGFLGQSRHSKKNPQAITTKEANAILNRHNDAPIEIAFMIGEGVEVTSGAFKTFKGTVAKIDQSKVTVDVMIFGRVTKVDMDISNIKKDF